MEERAKLPRLIKQRGSYTTGDAQDWTYEYTWEDFEEAIKTSKATETFKLRDEIMRSFIECPEKLLEGGVCKELGYSVEEIRRKLIKGANTSVGIGFRF